MAVAGAVVLFLRALRPGEEMVEEVRWCSA